MKKLSDFVKIPLRLFWDVTSECNFRCKHCYVSAGKKLPDELTHKETLSLVDEFKRMGIFRLLIAGGEPLMRTDIFNILKRVADYEIPAVMNTNGYLIDEKTAQKLSRYELDLVTISLDGSVPRTHENFRGAKGAFKKAVDALDFLRDYNIKTSVGCVLHRANYTEIPGIIDLCIKKEVQLINIMRIVPVGRATTSEEFSLTFNMHRELIHYFEKNYDELHYKITILSNNPILNTWLKIRQAKNKDVKGHYCQAGGLSGYIQANGDVMPCGYFPVVLGNIRNSSLKKIWTSSKTERVRELAHQLSAECLACKYLAYCQSGCRGLCYTLYQRTDVRDPLCYREFQEHVRMS